MATTAALPPPSAPVPHDGSSAPGRGAAPPSTNGHGRDAPTRRLRWDDSHGTDQRAPSPPLSAASGGVFGVAASGGHATSVQELAALLKQKDEELAALRQQVALAAAVGRPQPPPSALVEPAPPVLPSPVVGAAAASTPAVVSPRWSVQLPPRLSVSTAAPADTAGGFVTDAHGRRRQRAATTTAAGARVAGMRRRQLLTCKQLAAEQPAPRPPWTPSGLARRSDGVAQAKSSRAGKPGTKPGKGRRSGGAAPPLLSPVLVTVRDAQSGATTWAGGLFTGGAAAKPPADDARAIIRQLNQRNLFDDVAAVDADAVSVAASAATRASRPAPPVRIHGPLGWRPGDPAHPALRPSRRAIQPPPPSMAMETPATATVASAPPAPSPERRASLPTVDAFMSNLRAYS